MPWREVTIFLAVTFGGITLVGLLWAGLGDMNDQRDALVFGGLGMLTPTLGAIAATRLTGAYRGPARFLLDTGVTPSPPWGRLVRYLAVGLLLPLVIMAAALCIGSLAGVYRFVRPFPLDSLLAGLGTNLVTFVPLLVLMLGEELGWGYLLPRLLPLGLWPGLLASGTIWGLFHAPLTLQGYLFPTLPGVVGTLVFTLGSVLLAVLMGWLRLASANLWPAVVLHGSSNLLANPIPPTIGQATDPATANLATSLPGGWPSWVAMAVIIAGLAATGRYRRHYRPQS
ncbi:CPBP family glutamic-type intramembrane protease [Pseudonocardia acaciae]|uniref:CPBP family glutamic-type intramembrane protease n=1 Tax=Pseudonocardia acaciae TaxID=551276 RepID=UPI000687F32A|nr:CPBP family glutamic-type intramembrane protease [Pseudonocardia acaciae]